MQTVEVDCAPLSGQRTMECFFIGVPRGLAWMHKRMKEIV